MSIRSKHTVPAWMAETGFPRNGQRAGSWNAAWLADLRKAQRRGETPGFVILRAVFGRRAEASWPSPEMAISYVVIGRPFPICWHEPRRCSRSRTRWWCSSGPSPGLSAGRVAEPT